MLSPSGRYQHQLHRWLSASVPRTLTIALVIAQWYESSDYDDEDFHCPVPDTGVTYSLQILCLAVFFSLFPPYITHFLVISLFLFLFCSITLTFCCCILLNANAGKQVLPRGSSGTTIGLFSIFNTVFLTCVHSISHRYPGTLVGFHALISFLSLGYPSWSDGFRHIFTAYWQSIDHSFPVSVNSFARRMRTFLSQKY